MAKNVHTVKDGGKISISHMNFLSSIFGFKDSYNENRDIIERIQIQAIHYTTHAHRMNWIGEINISVNIN